MASRSYDSVDLQNTADPSTFSDSERHLMLYGWNDTAAEIPDACVHELFERQVGRHPDAVAVVFQGRQLSYRELNKRANQVAHYLQELGVGPEILVGVCLKRSPEMLIALLGVWKAGGAHVPLDPTYPNERLSFMLNDASLQIVLTDDRCCHLFSSAYCKTVSLNSDWQIIAQQSAENPTRAALPSNLAYVVYTSGSTGQPKGAMIQHNSLVNYLSWVNETYVLDEGASVPVHSSIAFDSTVASIYSPLLIGAQIELLPEAPDAQSLLVAMRRVKNRGKVVITPSHLELLNRYINSEEMAIMTKILVVAGENLSAGRVSQWREFAPGTRIINEYGPTETTVGCCAYEMRPEDPHSGTVPIGQPISNTQVYVLDSQLRLVRPGAKGELYIGGVGVGRGYLNRPELTRERFVANLFSNQKGARLYKTGDMVRYRKDGILEFVGREDDQVKVRGYRIELGEIEATLAEHPEVQSCVVSTREVTPGNKQLIGYITTRETSLLKADALRDFLRRHLPDHMVPGHFVRLDLLPLTGNGKIDRTKLPAPSGGNILFSQEFATPKTDYEKKLAAIWMELLQVDRVGIHEDLFELGADSLLVIKGLLRIQEDFGVVLSAQSLFPSATIAGLAKALKDLAPPGLAHAVPVQSDGKKPNFFYIGAGALLLRSLSAVLGSDQPLHCIDLHQGAAKLLAPPYRVEEVAHHLVLTLCAHQSQGPYYLSGFCQDAVFAYEVARQLTMQGKTVGLLVLFEPRYPRQNAKRQIATSWRRMVIRLAFRFGELRRLETGEFRKFVTNRYEGFKSMMSDILSNIAARLQPLKLRSCSRDLKQILFFAEHCYKPKALACPTVIFRCKDWPILSAGDPYFGWGDLLKGPTETLEVPGDHVGMFRRPNVLVLASQLQECIDNAIDEQSRERNNQPIANSKNERAWNQSRL